MIPAWVSWIQGDVEDTASHPNIILATQYHRKNIDNQGELSDISALFISAAHAGQAGGIIYSKTLISDVRREIDKLFIIVLN